MGVSIGYNELYGIKILAGRDFTATDYDPDFRKLHNMLINETAVKLLGFKSKEDAIGKTISVFGSNWDIVGVINDFHQKSLRYPLEPTVMFPTYGTSNPISVKINTQDVKASIAAIKKNTMRSSRVIYLIIISLMKKFNEQYASDQLFGKVFGIFSGFAIFIACLGLLGLSLFATAQRTKEIGVRKVLGASVSNIILLLSKILSNSC